MLLWIDMFGLLTAHFTCVILTNNITFAGGALLFVGCVLFLDMCFYPDDVHCLTDFCGAMLNCALSGK